MKERIYALSIRCGGLGNVKTGALHHITFFPSCHFLAFEIEWAAVYAFFNT